MAEWESLLLLKLVLLVKYLMKFLILLFYIPLTTTTITTLQLN